MADWRPIDDTAKDGRDIIVALIRDGRIWRVSDAKHNGLGFYTINGGVQCHWATHWMPMPPEPLLLTQAWVTRVTNADDAEP